MEYSMINLDDECEVDGFLKAYGNLSGLQVAHANHITGKGAKRRGNDLRNYAWNKKTAIGLRKSGNIAKAMEYEAICDRIYDKMHADDKW